MIGGGQLPRPTWFIGCGNMGQAILDGWKAADVSLAPLTIVRPSGKAIEGAQVVRTISEAGPPPQLVVLAFKPQKLDEIAAELRSRLTAKTVVVSLLAGVETASLRERFPGVAAIVRAMPNLPVAIRRGVVGLYSADADDKLRKQVAELFVTLGFAMWMVDEAATGRARRGRRRRTRLCRAVHRRAGKGRRAARAEP